MLNKFDLKSRLAPPETIAWVFIVLLFLALFPDKGIGLAFLGGTLYAAGITLVDRMIDKDARKRWLWTSIFIFPIAIFMGTVFISVSVLSLVIKNNG